MADEQAPTGMGEDTPLVRYLNDLLAQAAHRRASDLHWEPQAQSVRVRLRIDGVLHELPPAHASLRERLASRVKLLARLDIAERRMPQDGRLAWTTPQGQVLHLRVSTLPTLHGEKLVIRLLDHEQVPLDLGALGCEGAALAQLQEALAQPHGMLLFTGPTGSGKTQSLYACLQQLNHPQRNIATVEDPCEIRLPGLNQVNVHDKPGLDFATVLRAFMRQDPDVIMVGEIRDQETAQIALQAAQTGHLVLSSLHTPDAPGALIRLRHMGMPSYNIAGTLTLVVAQRLVRRLCPHCRRPQRLDAQRLRQMGAADDARLHAWRAAGQTVWTPVGCAQCQHGYRGRVGIFQVMPVGPALQALLLQEAGLQGLREQALREGLPLLRAAGLWRVLDGTSALEEVVAQTALPT